MKLSIVSTLYKSSPFIDEFIARTATSAASVSSEVEFVIVDDGSPDDSLEKVLKLKSLYPTMKVIQLSRNFGHHEAILTGLRHAQGDLIFLMDCDLEEAPEDLARFVATKEEDPEVDVVYGVQRQRSKGLLDKLLGRAYYQAFNLLSAIEIPRNLTTTRLMSRRFVDALLEHEEVDVVLSGLWANTGFRQIPLEVEKKFKGTTSYDLRRQLRMLVRSITSFSAKPLVYIFYLGLIISLIAFLAIVWITYQKLFSHVGLGGWTSLILSIWFIGGLLMLSVGVVGIYVERIFRQVKQRPRTIVKRIF